MEAGDTGQIEGQEELVVEPPKKKKKTVPVEVKVELSDVDNEPQQPQEVVEPAPEPVADAEPEHEGDQWWGTRKLDSKTWWETVDEMDAVMQHTRGRSWAQYGQATLDEFFAQMHPTMRNYTPPAPTEAVPEWWAAVRDPMARLMEGFGRMPWFRAVFSSTMIAVPLIPLPGFGFWNVPFIILGAALRLRVEHLDAVARMMNYPVQGLYIGTKWIIDNLGLAWTADHIVDPAIGWVGGKYKKFKKARAEKNEKKIKKWKEDGDSNELALSAAEWHLASITAYPNWPKVANAIERRAPQPVWFDLLDNFERPKSLVNLKNVMSYIQEGDRYHTFKSIMNTAGYDCKLAILDGTIVAEVTKRESDTPQPGA